MIKIRNIRSLEKGISIFWGCNPLAGLGAVSRTGKELLDSLCEKLEIERPLGVKIAIAKGLAHGGVLNKDEYKDGKPRWEIPDSIIKEREYLLFKHIIINETQKVMSAEEINEMLLLSFESGIRILTNELAEQTSLEDSKIKILG